MMINRSNGRRLDLVNHGHNSTVPIVMPDQGCSLGWFNHGSMSEYYYYYYYSY